jgi:fluoride exporter
MACVPESKQRFRGRFLMYLAVAFGAAIGGVLRAGLTLAAIAQFGSGFPWGTMAANVIGSFVIGAYAALTISNGRLHAGSRQKQFVMTGICGGFTTFSVFSLETFLLAASGDYHLAGLNIAGSVTAWLLAVWAGFSVGIWFNRLGRASPS